MDFLIVKIHQKNGGRGQIEFSIAALLCVKKFGCNKEIKRDHKILNRLQKYKTKLILQRQWRKKRTMI